MKINNPQLVQVAGFQSQFPQSNLKEIAFAGRSNVGKSTFINSIFNSKSLAKTSSTPGKTRTINFYNVDDKIMFVDLPGYGYAKASRNEQDKWADLINEYLHERELLKEVFLVIDARHKPSELDVQMYDWIKENGFTGYVIATKSDKLSNNKLNNSLKVIRETLDIDKDRDIIIPYSSVSKKNKNVFLSLLDEIIKE